MSPRFRGRAPERHEQWEYWAWSLPAVARDAVVELGGRWQRLDRCTRNRPDRLTGGATYDLVAMPVVDNTHRCRAVTWRRTDHSLPRAAGPDVPMTRRPSHPGRRKTGRAGTVWISRSRGAGSGSTAGPEASAGGRRTSPVLGTERFIVYMTVVTQLVPLEPSLRGPALRPVHIQVTDLDLSLQASYAAPLILLARTAGRPDGCPWRRTAPAPREGDTEYLAPEIASLGSPRRVATRDFCAPSWPGGRGNGRGAAGRQKLDRKDRKRSVREWDQDRKEWESDHA